MSDSNIKMSEEMEFTNHHDIALTNLTKVALLAKCEELGIKKCKSKTKEEIIQLITHHLNNNSNNDNQTNTIYYYVLMNYWRLIH
jgi:hypothetical protein